MNPRDLVLIAEWARKDWTAWVNIAAGEVIARPEWIGGSASDELRDAIPGATSWLARSGPGLVAEIASRDPRGPLGVVVLHALTWPKVGHWLATIPKTVRDEVGRVHRAYMAAYQPRGDELTWALWTSAEITARSALYEARMRDGARIGMHRCRERYLELLAALVTPESELSLFQVDAA